jgi:hypothetical protein
MSAVLLETCYYYYRYSALGPVSAEIRAQSGDWYSSGTLHPGQVLRGRLPLLSKHVERLNKEMHQKSASSWLLARICNEMYGQQNVKFCKQHFSSTELYFTTPYTSFRVLIVIP